MTDKERVMRRLGGLEVDKTPVGCVTAYGAVELMHRCGHERPLADFDPAAMAGLALAGHTIAGFEWVKAMGWDITSVSQALGCELGKPEIDLQQFIASHPYENKDLDGLECPRDLLQRGRFPAFKEQFRILKEQLGDTVAIFGMSEGPFTCAANLMGTSKMLRSTIKDPASVDKIMEVTTQALIEVINFAFDNGADFYCMADPSSGCDLLSPRSWSKFVAPSMKRIVQAAKGPIVLHICGAADPIIPAMCDTGLAAISIEEKADLKNALDVSHAKGVTVFGNVSASSTLFMGTPEDCYQEALAALKCGVDFLAPGCGLAPNSPLANILQLRKARDDFFSA